MHTVNAQHWIHKLNLEPHPEGGYYGEFYRCLENVICSDTQKRSACTSIYYLLENDQKSHLHRLTSDEIWHFYAGQTLIIYEISPEGQLTETALGQGETDVFQHVVPAGNWFGAKLQKPNGFSLVGCTVAPGFEYVDFELGSQASLQALYPQHQQLITELSN